MNVEKTIEFILEMQAKAEERFARAEARADRADRRMDRLEASIAQTNRVVKALVRTGRGLRSDVRELQRYRVEAEKFHARTEENLSEITGKLDALIDIVDKTLRRNGGKRA
jgi:ectoine hydroxylase-related dioxygenase (phytanoyl-CoA dioxygenase family)